MKNKIWIFLLSCIMVLGLCAAFVSCDLTEDVPHEIKYIVDGEVYYSQKLYSETEIQIPEDPSRLDYDFDGWYYDQDTWMEKLDPYNLTEGYLNHDIFVYGRWVPHTHTVTNGELTVSDGKFMFTGSCTCGQSYDGQVKPNETIMQRATCLTEGSSRYTYTLLGVEYSVTVVTPKGNHAVNGVDVSTLVDENGYFADDVNGIIVDVNHLATLACDQTADGFVICSDCGGYLNITIIKSHKYNVWTMVQVGAGEDEYFELSSDCARSDCDEHTVYIAEERYLSETVVSAANCSAKGSKTVVYNNGKITVQCNAVIEKTAHFYNGKPIDSYDTTNGAYNYYDKNGNAVFVNLFADQAALACGAIEKSYFDCENQGCDNLVYIEVYKNHRMGDAITVTAATCTVGGKVKYVCSDCAYFEERDIPETGHRYAYTLKLIEDGDNDYTNDTFEYTGACAACGEPSSTTTLNYSQLSHNMVRPTCTITGSHNYSYGSGSGYASLQIVIPTSDEHILNGVIAKNVFAGKDGVTGEGYSYLYSIEGIRLTANDNATCSVKTGELYTGYYQCESCAKLVNVDVFVDHIGERTTITAPGCGTPGVAEVDCEYCGDNQKTAIAPTGLHTYEYTIAFTPEEGPDPVVKYELASVCKVCKYEDHRVEIELVDINVEVKTFVNCLEDGVLLYTYNENGITAYGERVYALKGEHTVNNQLISELLKTVTSKGVEYQCIESNVPGVVLPAGTKYHVGDVVEGMYACDSCHGGVTVQVLIVESEN